MKKRLLSIVLLLLLTLPDVSYAQLLGTADIRILGLQVDVDTRPDLDGMQYTMTAVKDIPTGVQTMVGAPGADTMPTLPAGSLVKAELAGPSFGDDSITLSALPNQLMEIPPLGASGDHFLYNVRLVDKTGNPILVRDFAADLVVINVIDKLLVTKVTSRPLTLEEIQEKGIVIDEDNFTAMNFTVGLTLGSDQVVINMPVLVPNKSEGLANIQSMSVHYGVDQEVFKEIDIPNFSMSGFSLKTPPELEEQELVLPPINGVIIIPGNIAFLNQFFSVVVQASNVAPEGSELVLEDAQAVISLPLGGDGIKGTGDDPLRVAETQVGGIQEELPLVDLNDSDAIVPQGTNQAEFLVEGLREGTHQVNFDITGNLFIPSLGETVQMTGKAAGLVQVKNPTFSLVMAHPDVVRDGEEYSIFVTVTNTSSSPANLFQLHLNSRSLSGTRLAEGESDTKKLEMLLPGQAETFMFRLVARTTGKVTGMVFLADEGINGSFVLTTGVGDTGIPLSPDTLVLPQTVDYLPDNPDIVFAAVRLLGQAYSVATAPAGSLPPEITRISKSYVFERAVKLAQAGLHARFGEDPQASVEDILMDYFGNDLERLDTLYEDPDIKDIVRKDMLAFDILRRTADAGHYLSDILGQLIGSALTDKSLATIQKDWAELFSSRPPHLSFGISSRGSPAYLRISDAAENNLGRLNGLVEVRRDIPFADRMLLAKSDTYSDEFLFVASPSSESYTLEFALPEGESDITLSLVIPSSSDMVQVSYPVISFPEGSYGKMIWNRETTNTFKFQIDTTGDGVFDQTLVPTYITPIEDRPPFLIGVLQWAKGNAPMTYVCFDTGDPLGRMVGALFSEEVEKFSAEEKTNYSVPDHQINDCRLQPDRRMVFLMLKEPVGPFVKRELTATGIKDLNDLALQSESLEILADPDRGIGGVVTGIVQKPDGTPIPYARIKYLQPVECPGCDWGVGWIKDYAISTFVTDTWGRYQIDYVLKNGHVAYDNPDIWLNENNAGGTDNFKLEASDPFTGDIGKASTRIHYDGQRMHLNVIIRGVGEIEGIIYDEEGNVITGGDPGSPEVLYIYAKNIGTGESYRSWVDSDGYYSFPRTLKADDGTILEKAPSLAVGNVVLQVVRAADGYTGVATTNIPAAGDTVTQDIILVSPSKFGTVTGRVLEEGGTTGAPNVLVQIAGQVLTSFALYSRSYNNSVIGTTYTDENGNFSFKDIPTGDIEVHATRESTYEQAKVESYLQEGEEKSLTLILPGTGGTVRGYVRDALGNLISGANVAGGLAMTKTDQDGYFEILGLPLGEFTIWAQSTDSPALGKETVEILSSGDVQDIVITIEPVGTIQGTVYEADSVTPVVAQKVQLWAPGGVMAQALTDDEGRYHFDGYPATNYTIKAVREDYGDGGMAFTSIRFADDVRDADIVFRGLGEIKGRVIQSNGTPIISDVIVTRKVWRIIGGGGGSGDNYYLDYVQSIQEDLDEEAATSVQNILDQTVATAPQDEFFMLLDEPVILSSDILGPGGEVTGRFHFDGPATGGLFSVAAFGPFLAPTEVTSEIPKTTDPAQRIVDVGDIVLEPTTGEVKGTVYMPDGITPVGENVLVIIQCLDNSGSVRLPGNYGGSIQQPVLPEYDVVTDENGQFHFPLVLRGRFMLTADTGVPDPAIAAHSPAEMETERFNDEEGNRVLNVQLYGQINGVVPAYEVLTADIRLHDMAGIQVSVVENDGTTPVPYAEITVKTSSTLDKDEEAEFIKQIADDNGIIDFFPIIEGMFSVNAKAPASPATGQAEGEVPFNPPNGLQIPVKVTLGAVTTITGEVITTKIFGTVEGDIYKADNTPLENPAQVTIKAAGVNLLTNSDSSGHYSLENVPGGIVQVEIFEPFTARRGTASGHITTYGEVIDVPVTLAGLGTVIGQVINPSGDRVISGADIVLYPSGRFTDSLISRTDAQGTYQLPGVPLGRYTIKATDYTSELTGKTTAEMLNDGDINTTDIILEASGSITGIVYDAGVYLDDEGYPINSDGDPWPDAPVVANATIKIKGSQLTQTVQADADGVFISGEFLSMGRYTVTARPPIGNDGASATITLTYDGELAQVNLALNGSGMVEGCILDSLEGNPVDVAKVTLYSQSPYSPGPITRFTGADGKFLFEEIPVGGFSISVITTLQTPQLGGAVNGTLDENDQTIAFADGDSDIDHDAIRLQDSGQIIGIVILPDGVTPAEGAVVEIQGGGIRLALQADSNGSFSFDGLPLKTYNLFVREPVTNAVDRRTPTLGTNGQILDLGTIILDNNAPTIVSTSPEANSYDVAPSDPIVINLSELIDPTSVNSQTFRVTIDGASVEGTYSVSGIEPTVTFTPDEPLPDLTWIDIFLKGDKIGFEGQVLEGGIQDLAGLGLTTDLAFNYTTGDTTPPIVVSLSPADGSIEVALENVIRVEFSEPVDRNSIQSFTLSKNGEQVSGNMNNLPILGDRVFVFTPDMPLSPNASYAANLIGPVSDLAGNHMDQEEITISFSTIDTLAPVIVSLSYPTGVNLVTGKTVEMIVGLEDETDVANVEFYLNGELVSTVSEPPYNYNLYLYPNLGTNAILGAVAIDIVGNRSAQTMLPLTIAPNQPPLVLITAPDSIPVSIGETITVEVEATDDVGITQISFTANSGDMASQSKTIAATTTAQETFTFTIPNETKENSTIQLRAAAMDTLGLVSPSNEIILIVEDHLPPQVTIGSPAQNSVFDPGEEVSVFVRAEDSSGITEISISTSGALTFSDVRVMEPIVSPASATFTLSIPADALPNESITITTEAKDGAGNTGNSTPINIFVADILPPQVSVVIPENNALDISIAAEVVLAFSEPLDPLSVGSDSIIISSNFGPVSGNYNLSQNNTRVIFTPSDELALGTTYTVQVTTAIADEAGNTLDTPFVSTFTTRTTDDVLLDAVAYWKFDENEGSIVHDEVGENNNGTKNGASWDTGISGSALSLDGNSDYVDFGSSDIFNFKTQDFTIELWVNFNDTQGEQVLIEKFSGANGPGWTLKKSSSGMFKFGGETCTGEDGSCVDSAQTSLSVDTWYHLVVNRDQNLFTISLNGKSIGSRENDANFETNDPLLIGRRNPGDPRGFFLNGSIDEVAIYNRALTDREITKQYLRYAAGLNRAVAYDSSGVGAGIQTGDQVELVFDNETNAPIIDASNIDSVLALSYNHSWLDCNGNILGAAWNTTSEINDTLTITLSTDISAPTVATGDTITLDGNYLENKYGNPMIGSGTIGGNFGVLVPSSAMAFWTFDENIDNTTYDETTNEYDGILQGDTSWTTGKSGSSLNFDGDGDYVGLGNNLDFERTEPFSIETWIKRSSTGGYQTIISKMVVGDTYRGWGLGLYNDKLLFYLRSNHETNNYLAVESQDSYTNTADWMHVAITYDGTSSATGVKFYVNSDNILTTTIQDNLSDTTITAADANIGAKDNGIDSFNGLIDELVIHGRVLTSDEVEKNYLNLASRMISLTANDTSGKGPGIQAGDQVVVMFNVETNAPTIDASNIDSILAFDNCYGWLDGSGNIGDAVWSTITYPNDTLTITLTPTINNPTAAIGDTVTLDGNIIKNKYGAPIFSSGIIEGSFGAPLNNDPIARDDSDTTTEDVSVTTDVLDNDSDIDGDSLTVDALTQPANGTAINNGDGTITYTPNSNFTGIDSYTYTIIDGNGGTATATVTIEVIAAVPKTITLTSSTTQMPTRSTLSLTVNLDEQAGTDGITINLNISNAIVSGPISATVPEGATSISFDIVSGTDSGNVTISASAPNLTGDTITINVLLRTFNITSPLVGIDRTVTASINLNLPAPAGSANFSLSSANTDIAIISPKTVAVPQGQTTATFEITGQSGSSVPGSTIITADGSDDGYTVETLSITVTDRLIDVPTNQELTLSEETSFDVLIAPEAAPAGGIEVSLTSSNPELVEVLTPTIIIPEGSFNATGTIRASSSGTGTVIITASNPAYAPDSMKVNVTGALNIIQSQVHFDDEVTDTIHIQLESGGGLFPAPDGGVEVTLVSEDPSCVEVISPITIAEGSIYGTAILSYGGSTPLPCTTMVSATSDLFGSDTVEVTVYDQKPEFGTITITDRHHGDYRVGSSLQIPCRIALSRSDHGGITVQVKSSNMATAMVAPNANTAGAPAIEVSIPNGQTTYDFYLQGVDSASGTVTITASNELFTNGSRSFEVVPSVLQIRDLASSTTTLSSDDPFRVRTGYIHPNGTTFRYAPVSAAGPVTVTLSSSDITVGELKNSTTSSALVTIDVPVNNFDSPNSVTTGGVAFDPLGGGATTISASAVGFDNSYSGASYEVTVSQPGISITDIYHGDYRVGSSLQIPCRITLGGADHGGVTVRIASSDLNVVQIAPNATTAGTEYIDVSLADGQTTYDFYLQGVNSASGTVTITASNELFTTGSRSFEVVPSVLQIRDLASSTTTLSSDDPFRVRTGYIHPNGTTFRYAPVSAAGPVTVILSSSEITVGELKNSTTSGASVTIDVPVNNFDSSNSVTTGGVAFDPIGGGTTTISASAIGFDNSYSGASYEVTVSQPGISITDIYHGDYRVGSSLQIPCRITLGGADHGGVTVRIASSDLNVAQIAPNATTVGTEYIDVSLADGQTTHDFYLQGVDSASGTVTITASNELFTTGSRSFEVVPSVLQIRDLASSTTTLSSDDPFRVRTGYIHPNGTTFRYAPVSAAGPVTVTLTSSDITVGELKNSTTSGASVSIDVPVNNFDSPNSVTTGGVAFDPLGGGTTTISASAIGFDNSYSGASYEVTVSQPGISITDRHHGDYRIGGGLQIPCRITLGGADHGGVTVRIASSDLNVAQIAPNATTAGTEYIDVFLADGQTTHDFYLQGVDSTSGTVTITASNEKFTTGSRSFEVVPSVLQIRDLASSTTTLSSDDPFRVRTGYIHPNGTTFRYAPVSAAGPVTVTLTSSEITVGELKNSTTSGASVSIDVPVNNFDSPNSVTTGGVAFDPLAGGTTTISASAIGFDNSYSGASYEITVSQPGISITDRHHGDYRIGGGLQVPYSFTLGGPKHGGVTVRISSGDPNILLVSPDATTTGAAFIDMIIPDGETRGDFYIQGINGNTGTSPLTVSSAQFIESTRNIEVVPGVINILNLATTMSVSSADDPFQVRTGYVHANGTTFRYAPVSSAGPIQVTVSSSDSSVGQLKTSSKEGNEVVIEVQINQYDSASTVASGGVAFDPVSEGATTISAGVNGFDNSWNGSSTIVDISP